MNKRKPYIYEQRVAQGWCGPATLRMGLVALGFDISQEELAAQTHYHEKGETENADMLAAAKSFVPNSHVLIGKSLEELNQIAQKDVVIVEFADTEPQDEPKDGCGLGDDSHYVMLNGLTKDKVLVVDPNPISPGYGSFREIDRGWFEAHFWDEDLRGGITRAWALVIPAN